MPQDHPDIEKLPIEIYGIPVRETIREIFRDPANGTPDGITKAGCLALALKSNAVGGEGKGYVIWNVWRKAFPVSGLLETSNLKNHSQFAEIDFQQPENKVSSFACFQFGHYADFHGAHLGHSCNFQDAQWGRRANFDNARWGNFAEFDRARWGRRASFKNCQWGVGASFRCAHWGECSDFRGAHWGEDARFLGAHWEPQADFQGAQWGEGAKFKGAQWGAKADFRGACWESSANFTGAQWGQDINFCDTQWVGDVDFSAASWAQLRSEYSNNESYDAAKTWAEERGLSPDAIDQNSFLGARFLGEANFENRKFRGRTDFSNVGERQRVVRDKNGIVIFDAQGTLSWEAHPDQGQFSVPPKFHGCELHQDTSFDAAEFPKPSGDDSAARAYRTLKLAFSKQQAIREEQRFFRLEIEEETLLKTGLEGLLFKAYKIFSDYGFSVTRPMFYLILLPLSWMIAWYACLSLFVVVPTGDFGRELAVPTWLTQVLCWSLAGALPIPGIDLVHELRKTLFGNGSIAAIALMSELVQKVLSLIGFFLMGLALRNLFKLK